MLNIVVVALMVFIFGAVWFTVLFGKMWAKLMDFNPASADKYKNMGMVKPLIMNFLLNLLPVMSVYFLYPQILSFSFVDFWKAMMVVWLGFSFPIYANAGVWERKSWNLVLLNSVYGFFYFTIISAMVYYWPM